MKSKVTIKEVGKGIKYPCIVVFKHLYEADSKHNGLLVLKSSAQNGMVVYVPDGDTHTVGQYLTNWTTDESFTEVGDVTVEFSK
jgi:hypothetical protein